MRLFEGCFIRDMPKPFHELQIDLLHIFLCLYVVGENAIGCLKNIFKVWPGKVRGKL